MFKHKARRIADLESNGGPRRWLRSARGEFVAAMVSRFEGTDAGVASGPRATRCQPALRATPPVTLVGALLSSISR